LCATGVAADAEGVVVAAASGGAGCEGWVGFVLMGLLSSGRAFHMLTPFFFDFALLQTNSNSDQFKLTYDFWYACRRSIQDLAASLLLTAKIK
jgi:hypothetical protein